MLNFHSIKWKNFLATGNAFTEIKLDAHPDTLIVGKNGAGKSTLLDALTFGLFGKPFRKINKPGLMNSVNKKNTVVEVEFSTNSKHYKVIRGIKPNTFEIWCDDVCLNQNSASKDYQEHLEKFILKMNYKSFTQIVILGSASFKPFMQLTPADRRLVIEDLLDIQVFSVMNTLVKARLQENKEKLERNRIELYNKEEKWGVIDAMIHQQKKVGEEAMNLLVIESEGFRIENELLQRDIDRLEKRDRELLHENATLIETDFRKKQVEFLKMKTKLSYKLDTLSEHNRFYNDHDNCPTCKQSIEQDFKQDQVNIITKKVEDIGNALTKLEEKIDDCANKISEGDEVLKLSTKFRNEIQTKRTQIIRNQKSIDHVQSKINMKMNDSALEENKLLLEQTVAEIEDLKQEKQKLLHDRQYIETAVNLLKDGGIKTRIIKQYLPVINQKINKYLLQMGFFCNFHLSENFEETIKSSYRDEFSYHNFSEGQKKRIDLAILLAWRAVARMRNSVNTNLLIFDEVFDSALDADGTDEFLKIMKHITNDTNVIVISPKQDQFIERFSKVYKFELRRNFSRMVE